LWKEGGVWPEEGGVKRKEEKGESPSQFSGQLQKEWEEGEGMRKRRGTSKGRNETRCRRLM